ncbi:hypothetical protein MACH09_24450 [Vibrio sp. MACH09]|nr:hypothetical protein MACH09_24450 [Vibrio sp. MACH09]
MGKKDLEAFAREAAKSIKTPADLNIFYTKYILLQFSPINRFNYNQLVT